MAGMEDLTDILQLGGGPQPTERVLQIFSEACRLFATRGFGETSIRDIAESCGISKATLYHHFADKDALVRPLVLGTTRAIHDHVAEKLQPALPPVERLRVFMVESATCFERFRWAWIASASIFWNDPEERHRHERLLWRDRYEGLLRAILRDGIQSGALRPMDPSLAGRLVLSTLNWLPRWYKEDGPLRPAEIAEQFFQMILNGMQAPRI
jgi:TetR/AcrR family transcriptional regulator, cholesterol catabolism regulator